jgi:hypothetical protein
VITDVCNKLMKRDAAAESGAVGNANQWMLLLSAGAPPTGVVLGQ